MAKNNLHHFPLSQDLSQGSLGRRKSPEESHRLQKLPRHLDTILSLATLLVLYMLLESSLTMKQVPELLKYREFGSILHVYHFIMFTILHDFILHVLLFIHYFGFDRTFVHNI